MRRHRFARIPLRTRGPVVLLTVAALGVAGAGTAGAGAAQASDGGRPVVVEESGALRGVTSTGVDSFFGVPYASPPVGDLRWRPPRPVQSWKGTRDAIAYGNRCAALPSASGPRSEAEDCLYLNVQRPAGARPGERLPVFVYVHGGALTSGSSNLFDSRLIVRSAHVVVVTINYRLGVFGFLAHPGLTAEAGTSGDYGFMDQQAALSWVHRNIAAFGGDPAAVTVGGESAGGMSVCAHLVAPGSRGLFARAIVQSGSCASSPLATLEKDGVTVAEKVGCTDAATAVRCLRDLGAATLLDGAAAMPAQLAAGVPVLPQQIGTAVAAGAFTRVPLLIGATRDEGRYFARDYIGTTRAQYESTIRSSLPASLAEQVLARYPWPDQSDRFTPAYLIGALLTDFGAQLGFGGCTTRALTGSLVRYTRAYVYEFDHRTGPGPEPAPEGYVWGAGHAGELAYLWPDSANSRPIAATFTDAERRLSADMVSYWGSFIRTGQPVAPRSARWTEYQPGGPVLSLRPAGASKMISDGELSREHNCDLWDPLLP